MNTNSDKYKWGLFYFNRGDYRVIVPKANKWMGWTFNFASPFTYIIIFVFILLFVFLSKY
jgi:uncharacterized membrane protein